MVFLKLNMRLIVMMFSEIKSSLYVQLISKLLSTPQISRSRFITVFSACKDGFLKFERHIFYIG
jgi:hypothetical protein